MNINDLLAAMEKTIPSHPKNALVPMSKCYGDLERLVRAQDAFINVPPGGRNGDCSKWRALKALKRELAAKYGVEK